MSHLPSVSIDHHHIANLAAVVHQVVGQLVGALIDLLVCKDTLGGLGALGFHDADSIGMLLGVGSEDLVDSLMRTMSYQRCTSPRE